MKNANKYDVRIDDLDVAGPELSDEELRGAHGGTCMWQGLSTCHIDGGDDWDQYEEPCMHVF